MKKILLAILLSLNFISIAQTDWFQVGAKWHYSHHLQDYVTLEIEKDSIWNGRTVQKMKIEAFPNPQTYYTWVYAENDSVFYYNDTAAQFYLLYDFSAEIDDEVLVHDETFKVNESFLTFTGDANCWKYSIDSISQKVISQQTLKEQYISDDFSCEWGFRDMGSDDYVIIEKMGSTSFFFGDDGIRAVSSNTRDNLLRCYSDPSGVNYKNPNWNYPCDTVISPTSIKELTSKQLNIFPNPASNYIQLELGSENNIITIQNLQGQIVYREELQNQNPTLNIDYLPSGLYLISVTDTNGVTYEAKLMKE